MSKYKRLYKKGKAITSLDELAKQKYIYCFDKITHIGWALSWQVRLAKEYIERGVLYYAEKVEDQE